MNPDELLMGALPYTGYSHASSMNISTGTGGTGSPGDVGSSSEMNGVTGVAKATASSGMAVLVTWFLLLFLLIAINVVTLKIQR